MKILFYHLQLDSIALEYHLLLSLDKNHATPYNLAPAVETLKANRQQRSQLSSMEYRYAWLERYCLL